MKKIEFRVKIFEFRAEMFKFQVEIYEFQVKMRRKENLDMQVMSVGVISDPMSRPDYVFYSGFGR